MRTIALSLLVALAGMLASEPAEAHRRVRVGVGFYYGGPFWHPWWYAPPPYYYYPAPVVTVPAEPTTYIEQGRDTTGWWYYCESSRGYYPYVKECPTGWERVPPAPTK